MITVYVDRDSVAAGDDTESHGVRWEFDDWASPGDVLRRVLDSGYLASVGGPVSWLMLAGEFELTQYDGWFSLGSRAARPAAVVHQPSPYGDAPQQTAIIALDSSLLLGPLIRSPQWAVGDRSWAVELRYCPAGALLTSDEYTAWLDGDEARRRGIAGA